MKYFSAEQREATRYDRSMERYEHNSIKSYMSLAVLNTGQAVIFTVGLMLPWREAALERYKMRHSYYGDLPGRFDGRGWEFFKRGWWLWLLGVLLLALTVWAAVRKVPAAPFLLMVAAPFVYGAFKAVEWRWWLSGIRFGDVWLESALSPTALIGLYWKVIGWMLLLMVLFSGYMFACLSLVAVVNQMPMAKLFMPGNLQANIPLIGLMAVGYLALILAMNVVMQWRKCFILFLGCTCCAMCGRGSLRRRPYITSRRRRMFPPRASWQMRWAKALPTGLMSPGFSAGSIGSDG